MTIATFADVAARIGRPLNTLERAKVTALLVDAEEEIRRLGPDRLTDPAWELAVVSVECSVVIRAARLPDGMNQVLPAEEGTQFPVSRPLQGTVELWRNERRKLGLPLTGAVDITPGGTCDTSGFPEGWPEGWCP
jgi:hypothetical protein